MDVHTKEDQEAEEVFLGQDNSNDDLPLPCEKPFSIGICGSQRGFCDQMLKRLDHHEAKVAKQEGSTSSAIIHFHFLGILSIIELGRSKFFFYTDV